MRAHIVDVFWDKYAGLLYISGSVSFLCNYADSLDK